MRRALFPPPPLLQKSNELFEFAAVGIVDALLEDRGWLEHHDAPRRDRHFLAGLGIAPDALAFLAHHEGTKGRQFHRLASFKAIGDFLQYHLNERGRFRARKPY